jgi:hypothetical protein
MGVVFGAAWGGAAAAGFGSGFAGCFSGTAGVGCTGTVSGGEIVI